MSDKEEKLKGYDEKVKQRLDRNSVTRNGCWVYTGTLNSNGYGRASYHGKKWGAHRLAHHLFVGLIPAEKFVCHHCDNPLCIRPEHLFLSNNKGNMKDMVSKGRQNKAKGERHSQARLDKERVREIREAQGTVPRNELAIMYGVTPRTINMIQGRETWKHLA